jgi:ribulose-phosphate 3-epimerase
MSTIVAPSILAADFANLQKDIEIINSSAADWFHVDIMDGVFVPNISFGFPVVEAIHKYAKKPLDVHLMIVDPNRYIQKFKSAGAAVLTVHLEACNHLHRTIQVIKDAGMKAGVAINPHTSIDLLENIIADADVICVMSVNPGFGGQKFIEHTFKKIEKLKSMIVKNNSIAKIEVDGGVNLKNAKELINAGADILVAGNFVFGSRDPKKTIEELKAI